VKTETECCLRAVIVFSIKQRTMDIVQNFNILINKVSIECITFENNKILHSV
jgi:hypothetical protein